MDLLQYENRCGSFRHTYREQIVGFAEFAERSGSSGLQPVGQLARQMETR
jgi:hypothetical protein